MKCAKFIKVGFQARSDTFTGKLGFVISDTSKTVAWDKWRDKEIPTLLLENTPVSGFHLNKSVHRESRYSGRDVVRIWDPRGFEFEISPANLLHIMEYCDIKGKEIIGDLVYCWDGANLLLMPTTSETYRDAIRKKDNFDRMVQTGIVDKSGKSKFNVGETYIVDKYKEPLVYLGVYSGQDFAGVKKPYRALQNVEDGVEMRVFIKNEPERAAGSRGTIDYTRPDLWDLRFLPLGKDKGKPYPDAPYFDSDAMFRALHRALPFQESLEYVLGDLDVFTADKLASDRAFFLVRESEGYFEVNQCGLIPGKNGAIWSKPRLKAGLDGDTLLKAVVTARYEFKYRSDTTTTLEEAHKQGYQVLLLKGSTGDYFFPDIEEIRDYTNIYSVKVHHSFNQRYL